MLFIAREKEREREVKKCQNSRSFEHPFFERRNTFDQKTSRPLTSSSLSGRSRRQRAPKIQHKRSVEKDKTPLPGGIYGVFDALLIAFPTRNTNECATRIPKPFIVVREKREKKTYHALFDVEALHRAFHLLIRVRAWDRRGRRRRRRRRRLSRRRQSLLVVGRHLLQRSSAYSPN